MRSELTAFWRATSEEDMAQDTIICTDESFTPDLYVMILLLNSIMKLYLLWVKTNKSVFERKEILLRELYLKKQFG